MTPEASQARVFAAEMLWLIDPTWCGKAEGRVLTQSALERSCPAVRQPDGSLNVRCFDSPTHYAWLLFVLPALSAT